MKASEKLLVYRWLYELLLRAGRDGVTREEVSRKWQREHLDWSGGQPMSRATFFNYRREVEMLFGVTVLCRRLTTGCSVFWIEEA